MKDVLTVRCPLCFAKPGEPCLKQNTPIGVREVCIRPHVERYELTKTKAGR